LTWADDRSGSQGVLVLERALEHVRDDLHVAMPMRPETLAGRDAIFVDDPKSTKAHVLGIEVIGEGECMARLEPPVVRKTTSVAWADDDHEGILLLPPRVAKQITQQQRPRPS